MAGNTPNRPGAMFDGGLSLPDMIRSASSPHHQRGGAWTTPHVNRFTTKEQLGGYASPGGNNSEQFGGNSTAASSPFQPKTASPFVRGPLRVNNKRGGNSRVRNNQQQASCPASLSLITCTSGDPLLFSETNLDWSKLNIFRTRLCDRLTQTHSCHMANRCLFSHEVNWPRRTPFLPRASALTLRYIPVWCPRVNWPPLKGLCDNAGNIDWVWKSEGEPTTCGAGACPRGDNCPFVHSIEEFLYHPEVYKTRSCCLANDENFDEDIHQQHCMALCPWYFCPFAHDSYEIRDVRGSRYAWHQPPQIVDNQYVARTQGFDALEMAIIDFVRKRSSNELYTLPNSPLKVGLAAKELDQAEAASTWLPGPVLEPAAGSSLEALANNPQQTQACMDDLLALMALASLVNLLLYPVENFYVPTLLSLQCSILQYQLNTDAHLTAAQLVDLYNAAQPPAWSSPSTSTAASAEATADGPANPGSGIDMESILDLLQSEDILRLVLDQQQRKNR